MLKANDGSLRCVRFALRPDRLTEGMYFVDSFPVKLYYKDGRLFAQMQTSTRVWTVDTSDFRQGQWSRVSDFCPTCFLFLRVCVCVCVCVCVLMGLVLSSS